MSARSNMYIFNHKFSGDSTARRGDVEIVYNLKACAPKCTAVVHFEIDGIGKNILFTVTEHGRKVRNTKADAERVGYVLETARRWYYTTYGITAFE